MRPIPVFVMLLALSGCDGGGELTADPAGGEGVTPTASASATAGTAEADAEAVAMGARSVEERNELVDFSFSYPEEAGEIPPLARQLDAMLEDARTTITQGAREGREEARDSGFPFNQYWYHSEWERVAELPDWLSLSSEIGTYTGGAHGNQAFDSLLWNKEAARRMEVIDLFTSKAALSEAVREAFCDELDKQRAEKRGEPVERDSEQIFDECIDPVEEATLILGSTNGRTFNRIGMLVPPYSAGPYAEGSYEITLPVTSALLAAVKDEYKASFTAPRN